MQLSQTVLGIAILTISAAAFAGDPARPYEGMKLVTVEAPTARELLAAMQFGEPLDCIPSPGRLDLIVDEDGLAGLQASGMKAEVFVADLQAAIDAETTLNEAARAERGASFFSAYRTITEINTHLDELDAVSFVPAEQVTKFSVGTTVEGRTIYGLRITAPIVPGQPTRPIFLITAAQHAREWAATSSAMWIAERLTRDVTFDPVIAQLVNNVDFRIIPVVNPDGYRYTFPTSQGGGGQRLWRKNRRQNPNGSFGVDLNRNWSYGWGLNGGSSTSQSSDVYRGPSSFSEPETTAVSNFALSLPNLKAHIDLHTYSQLVLGPWGFTESAPPRLNELNPLTSAMLAAISGPYGTEWVGGPASTTLYIASGVAPDWSFATLGALSWTYELRDEGFFGFQLPPDQIIPTGVEALEGIKVLAQHIQIRLRIDVPAPPTTLTPAAAAPFHVTMTPENSYQLLSGTETLQWRSAPNAPFESVQLTGGPTIFTATLPGVGCGSEVEFFVQAMTNDGFITRSPTSGAYTASTAPCPSCPGDADGDLLVAFPDLTAILSNWSRSGPPGIAGDANDDGTIDFGDFNAVFANWGHSCG